MLALDKSDIEDIANGNHNSYVESQDKDELLRELAERLLKATPDTSDIDDNLNNISDCLNDISDCLNDIDDILIKAEEVKGGTYDSVTEKIADIEEYLDGVRNVLQSITQ